jgi:hypothetical protein
MKEIVTTTSYSSSLPALLRSEETVGYTIKFRNCRVSTMIQSLDFQTAAVVNYNDSLLFVTLKPIVLH